MIIQLPILFVWFASTAFGLNPDQISGVYKYSFKSGLVTSPGQPQEIFTVENVLELVKVSNQSMYFKTKLNFLNGHQCSLSGLAHTEGDELVYKSGSCTFKIKISKDAIKFEDVEDQCRRGTCGARGGYNSISFLPKQKRNIRYMKRLMNSDDFKRALQNSKK